MKLLSEAIEQYIYIYALDWRLVSVSECWDRELTGATRVKFSQCWIGDGVGFGLRGPVHLTTSISFYITT